MKYSPEIRAEICRYLEQGMTQTDAATLCDISDETFHQWKNHRPDFAEALKKAAMKCKQRNVAIIQKAAITTWTAAAWWLERKMSEEFALKTKVGVDDSLRDLARTFLIRAKP